MVPSGCAQSHVRGVGHGTTSATPSSCRRGGNRTKNFSPNTPLALESVLPASNCGLLVTHPACVATASAPPHRAGLQSKHLARAPLASEPLTSHPAREVSHSPYRCSFPQNTTGVIDDRVCAHRSPLDAPHGYVRR